MNCMSVQEKRTSYEQRSQAYQHNSNTTSRVGLRSCLRGEIEDTESKRNQKILFKSSKISVEKKQIKIPSSL